MRARRVFTDRFGSLAVMGITRLLITVHERTVSTSAFQFSCLNGVALGQSVTIKIRPGGAGGIIGSKMGH